MKLQTGRRYDTHPRRLLRREAPTDLRFHAGRFARLKNVRFCVSLSLDEAGMMATELEQLKRLSLPRSRLSKSSTLVSDPKSACGQVVKRLLG